MLGGRAWGLFLGGTGRSGHLVLSGTKVTGDLRVGQVHFHGPTLCYVDNQGGIFICTFLFSGNLPAVTGGVGREEEWKQVPTRDLAQPPREEIMLTWTRNTTGEISSTVDAPQSIDPPLQICQLTTIYL